MPNPLGLPSLNTRMSTLTKVPCRRCGGSGHFAYNLIHGTMCYGCRGTKYQMVDLDAERKRRETSAAKRQKLLQYHDEVRAVSDAVADEFNAKYGPVPASIDTTLGLDQLNRLVSQKTGKSLWLHRDDRLKALNIRKP